MYRALYFVPAVLLATMVHAQDATVPLKKASADDIILAEDALEELEGMWVPVNRRNLLHFLITEVTKKDRDASFRTIIKAGSAISSKREYVALKPTGRSDRSYTAGYKITFRAIKEDRPISAHVTLYYVIFFRTAPGRESLVMKKADIVGPQGQEQSTNWRYLINLKHTK